MPTLTSQRLSEFEATHKGARLRWSVGEHFPDKHIAEAYLHPQVNHDATHFVWKRGHSEEDDEAVRRYCTNVLLWSTAEVSNITGCYDLYDGSDQACVESSFAEAAVEQQFVPKTYSGIFQTIRRW